MRRRVRKHLPAIVSLIVYNLILFYPVLFQGRIASPNDVFYAYEPWSSHRPAGMEAIQNPLLVDPPTSYYTLMSLLRSEHLAFHWNPYIASGAPGFGSSASAVLSPFIAIPTFLVPLPWVFTAVLFFKLNVAFLLAWLWLREERVGKYGAAIGAVIIAGSGIYAVRWWWQVTNATALYPALLWIVRRTFNNRRAPIAVTAAIAFAYALAGFPSTMAYGAYLVVAYGLFLSIRERRIPMIGARDAALGVGIGLAVAAPSVVPLVQWVPRSGYLDMRLVNTRIWFPWSHWRSFFAPMRLGNPRGSTWTGDLSLGALNNFVEATIYVGLAAIVFAAFSLLSRNRRTTERFWFASAIAVLCIIFGFWFVPSIVGSLPGFKYSMLGRVNVLLPPAAGYLAAVGGEWLLVRIRRPVLRKSAAVVVAVLAAVDLASFAARFYPYVPTSIASVRSTALIEFLRAQPGPFRVAPFFDYLWPNTSELFRIEDVRSHLTSELAYRKLLLRLDPGSTGKGTYLGFNSLKFDFSDPLAGMLNIRYFVEQSSIDIVKWKAIGATTAASPQTGEIPLTPGVELRRTIRIHDPFWAIELPARNVTATDERSAVSVSLEKNATVVWSQTLTPEEIRFTDRIYLPVRPYAHVGEEVTVVVHSAGVSAMLLRGTAAEGGESPLYYGMVHTPVVFARLFADGHLFRNLSEVPRFHPVRSVRAMTAPQFLAARDIDFDSEAVLTDGKAVPGGLDGADARVILTSYKPAQQRMDTDSSTPFLLASSEKLSPELRVTIDRKRVPIFEINTLFAGVVVPPGSHRVIFSRRLARGWWPVAGAGLLLWVTAGIADWRRRERPALAERSRL